MIACCNADAPETTEAYEDRRRGGSRVDSGEEDAAEGDTGEPGATADEVEAGREEAVVVVVLVVMVVVVGAAEGIC